MLKEQKILIMIQDESSNIPSVDGNPDEAKHSDVQRRISFLVNFCSYNPAG